MKEVWCSQRIVSLRWLGISWLHLVDKREGKLGVRSNSWVLMINQGSFRSRKLMSFLEA